MAGKKRKRTEIESAAHMELAIAKAKLVTSLLGLVETLETEEEVAELATSTSAFIGYLRERRARSAGVRALKTAEDSHDVG